MINNIYKELWLKNCQDQDRVFQILKKVSLSLSELYKFISVNSINQIYISDGQNLDIFCTRNKISKSTYHRHVKTLVDMKLLSFLGDSKYKINKYVADN